MKIYPNFFAYLNDCPLPLKHNQVRLNAKERPVIYFTSTQSQSFLMTVAETAYEVAFPYLNIQDIAENDEKLEHTWNLEIDESIISLTVADEVIDAAVVESEEQLQELSAKLGNRLDEKVASLLQIITGLFEDIFDKKSEIPILQLQQKLAAFNIAEATKPLIISLEERYELRRKLKAITPKLRHQLRRQAELMSVARIQEMDVACLRDYIRRPGKTAAQKAGSKQELMGVQRYQDYNTAENKFLVYFTERILHLECYRYERSNANQYEKQVQKFRFLLDAFKQHSTVQTIQTSRYQFTQPNYVLQQNPTYSSFWKAYLDYINKKKQKQQIWAYRNQLLADTVYICMLIALIQFTGLVVEPLSRLECNASPDKGHYLKNTLNGVKTRENEIKIFLQNCVYVFQLNRSSNCDWKLTAELHYLNSQKLETQKRELPIWVFWYCPSSETISQAEEYLQNSTSYQFGLLLYLQAPSINLTPESSPPSSKCLGLYKLSDYQEAGGFLPIVHNLARIIQVWISKSFGDSYNS
jgi:Domain of unknown function (DUF2357)